MHLCHSNIILRSSHETLSLHDGLLFENLCFSECNVVFFAIRGPPERERKREREREREKGKEKMKRERENEKCRRRTKRGTATTRRAD